MLSLDVVTKRFDAKTAVKDVTLGLSAGSFLGIIGRSGAGKSTLLRMINRLTEPTSGRIFCNGTDVTRLGGQALRDWRSDCAMIFQQFNLIRRMSALDNVLVGTLVMPGLLAQCRESPGRLRMIALHAPFAAAVRVIHRIHGHAANRGPNAAPARPPGLSEGFVLMVEIAHLANRGHAIHGKLANFARRQLHQRDFAFLAQQLR